ncbi:hypothetical protein LshimejAT787_0703200 [Lyophyllum shimeji]|uniref:Uncharacterized protein n=1 Tax=Lyophyllum shimeji TaxID=47721 RepID=A0A9P3PNQ8_LYOSH|nr:hypothetical protein LshimejAT787_0703200 [Lyophyllum shimeji]
MAPASQVIDYAAVMCESLLTGAYAVLVGVVVWVLKTGHRTMPTTHKVLFGASIVMFLISVAHLGLLVQQVTVTPVPKPNFQIQIVLCTIQFVIGDLILIWRVWIVWERNYWVALGPLAIMIVAAGFAFNFATHNFTETRSFFMAAPSAMIVANTSICTLLIVGRIWYMRYEVSKLGGVSALQWSAYRGALTLVIESGALYALSQLLSLILNHIGSVGLPVMLNLEIPLIGILPTLIIVCVHFQMIPGTRTLQRHSQSHHNSTSHPTRIVVNTFTSRTVIGDRMEFKAGTLGIPHDDDGLARRAKTDASCVV